MVDEHNRVYIGAQAKEENKIHVNHQHLANTKITSSAANEKKRMEKQRNSHHPSGRAISVMEILSVILGYDQVHHNMNFVQMSTAPLAERAATEKVPKVTLPCHNGQQRGMTPLPSDLDSGTVIPSFKVRNIEMECQLPSWRQLSSSEELILKDQALAPLSVDAITRFGIRPPELRFVRNPKLYYRWFFNGASCGTKAPDIENYLRRCTNRVLDRTEWVDGFNKLVHVREKAVPEILEYLQGTKEADFYPDGCAQPASVANARTRTKRFFKRVYGKMQDPPHPGNNRYERWRIQSHALFGPDQYHREHEDLPIVWWNSIPPTQSHRWIVHLLISMGSFDNEFSLFANGSLRNCFKAAKLINDLSDDGVLKFQILTLLRRYVLEQLVA